MTFGNYNNWALMSGMNTGLFNYNYNCCNSNSSYMTGQFVSSIFCATALATTNIIVSSNRQAKAAKNQVYKDAENAVKTALEKMPSPYNTESTYSTTFENMTDLTEVKNYSTAQSATKEANADYDAKKAKTPGLKTSYDSAEEAYQTALKNYENALNNNDKTNLETLEKLKNSKQTTRDNAKTAYEAAQKAENEAKTAKEAAERKETEAKSAYDSRKQAIEKLQANVETAINELNALKAQKESSADQKALDKADGNWAQRHKGEGTSGELTTKAQARQSIRKFRKQLEVYEQNPTPKNEELLQAAYTDYNKKYTAYENERTGKKMNDDIKAANDIVVKYAKKYGLKKI